MFLKANDHKGAGQQRLVLLLKGKDLAPSWPICDISYLGTDMWA
jgi:hypothetical protein